MTKIYRDFAIARLSAGLSITALARLWFEAAGLLGAMATVVGKAAILLRRAWVFDERRDAEPRYHPSGVTHFVIGGAEYFHPRFGGLPLTIAAR